VVSLLCGHSLLIRINGFFAPDGVLEPFSVLCTVEINFAGLTIGTDLAGGSIVIPIIGPVFSTPPLQGHPFVTTFSFFLLHAFS
jgi:hypothetical protein